MPQIPYPYSHNMIFEVKKKLYELGYRGKKNYPGAEKVGVTKYWWDEETIHMVSGGHTYTVRLPAGYFYAYIYKYPIYDKTTTNIVGYESQGSGFYDDSLDDKLGGEKELLGV